MTHRARVLILGYGLLMAACGPPPLADSPPSRHGAPGQGPGELEPMLPPLSKQDVTEGSGPEAKKGDRVLVHYTGTLLDGTKFDSSLDRGSPFEFVIGQGSVIAGWDLGVVGMKKGGKRKLKIPPHLGYGSRGSPPKIGPDATLLFDIELVDIVGGGG